ncbi:hypothetical protein MJO28_010057 [Puccinia striiformis f. sp. tritici]|uniref:Uncharacterized protein n=3 Tax=Puccinia striiformis TaxID=27350 RepID=A0A2S4WGN3_9BASI|nr:hypothetical protein Pst134EB_018028 [Puccinia striiformis f. sp. tritici]KAI7948149.1 hypothetical protein MJO28_010057 [Puccinia striiformis f. sp. tritici]KAI7951145.1 hypothetical protein MJO29_009819 [Puccinia striiformis f. sp. tritici]POW11857.1 hypothetical protein PSTT_04964 [Puccinia striiformis]POW20923.1 hypothetical protein PSHT_02970 [Puccinia striiformis]
MIESDVIRLRSNSSHSPQNPKCSYNRARVLPHTRDAYCYSQEILTTAHILQGYHLERGLQHPSRSTGSDASCIFIYIRPQVLSPTPKFTMRVEHRRSHLPLLCYLQLWTSLHLGNPLVRRSFNLNTRIEDGKWVADDVAPPIASWTRSQAWDDLRAQVNFPRISSDNSIQRPTDKTLNLFPLNHEKEQRVANNDPDEMYPSSKRFKLRQQNTQVDDDGQPGVQPSGSEQRASPSSSNASPFFSARVQSDDGVSSAQQDPNSWRKESSNPKTTPAPNLSLDYILSAKHLQPTRVRIQEMGAAHGIHSHPVPHPESSSQASLPDLNLPFPNSPTVFNPAISSSWVPDWKDIRQRYSCQILETDTTTISPKFALGAHTVLTEFRKQLIEVHSTNGLRLMQSSPTILIPFIYKLTSKPLSTHHWSQVIKMWRELWRLSETLQAGVTESSDVTLKKFLWISDFICESTMPQLFDKVSLQMTELSSENVREKVEFKLRTNEARIIRYLSDGRRQRKKSTIYNIHQQIKYVSEIMNKECNSGDNVPNHLAYSEENIQKQVLHYLQYKAQSITRDLTDVIEELKHIQMWTHPGAWKFFVESLVYKRAYNPQEMWSKLSNFPVATRLKIDGIFCRVELTSPSRELLVPPANSAMNPSIWLERILKGFDDKVAGNPDFSYEKDSFFLPQRMVMALKEIYQTEQQRLSLWA